MSSIISLLNPFIELKPKRIWLLIKENPPKLALMSGERTLMALFFASIIYSFILVELFKAEFNKATKKALG